MAYKIEKNIPMPSKLKYPIDALEVGDSFIISDTYSKKIMQRLSGYISAWRKKHDPSKMFITQKTENNKIRIWRLK